MLLDKGGGFELQQGIHLLQSILCTMSALSEKEKLQREIAKLSGMSPDVTWSHRIIYFLTVI
jgi:hypothetical protein